MGIGKDMAAKLVGGTEAGNRIGAISRGERPKGKLKQAWENAVDEEGKVGGKSPFEHVAGAVSDIMSNITAGMDKSPPQFSKGRRAYGVKASLG